MHFAKASLREGGGTRSVTEGAYGTMTQNSFHRNAFSLTRLRRELPPGGSLIAFICTTHYPAKLQFTVQSPKRADFFEEIFLNLLTISFKRSIIMSEDFV